VVISLANENKISYKLQKIMDTTTKIIRKERSCDEGANKRLQVNLHNMMRKVFFTPLTHQLSPLSDATPCISCCLGLIKCSDVLSLTLLCDGSRYTTRNVIQLRKQVWSAGFVTYSWPQCSLNFHHHFYTMLMNQDYRCIEHLN
jgi:hypothetical protein